jgi:hypothetical protein
MARVVVGILSALALTVGAGSAHAQARPVTIDVSAAGTGSMPRDAFNRHGVVFDHARNVGRLGGDEALYGGAGAAGSAIVGTFNGVVDRLAVRVAVGPVGRATTVALTLTAFDEAGPIAEDATVVAVDLDRDVGTGYVTLEVGALPRPAERFEVSARVVATDASWCAECAWFGIGELSFTLDEPDVDPYAPIVTVPSPMRVNATSPAGARVTYTVRATDDRDPDVTPTCTPPSGSTFPIGTTGVTCTARDAAGNVSEPWSFSVEAVVVGRRLPHRNTDHVVSFGALAGGAQRFTMFAEAGPGGANPRGWSTGTGFFAFRARVTCVRVQGNRATVGSEIVRGHETLGRGVLVHTEDNGDGGAPDRTLDYAFSATPPRTCPPPREGPSPLLVDGDVDVHDAPALPVSRRQCRGGAWRRYGVFGTERECLRFVTSGAWRPERGE